MSYHGDIRLGDTIDIKFTTTAASTGAPTTLSGTPVISAYPGNSTTQLTAGITLTVDFDSVTGLNNVRVVASSGNGYATATNYALVITTGTVGGTSAVGYVVGTFSIENRSAVMPTTAGRTLDVSAGGEAGVDWANVGSQSTSVNLSGTTTNVVNTASAVTTVNGLASNVITAAATATDFGTEVATAVWASGTRVLTANTNLNDPTAAAIADAVWDEAATGHTDAGKAGAQLWTDIDAILADTNELQTDDYPTTLATLATSSALATAQADLDTLTGADGATISSASVAALADQVWEEAIADHSGTAGSTAEQLAAAGAAGDPWSTALPGAYGAGTAGKIVGDNLNATVSSRASQTSVDDLPTNSELATALGTADDAVLAAISTVDSNVDAIKAKTDGLTFTQAGQVDANVQSVNDVAITGDGSTTPFDVA